MRIGKIHIFANAVKFIISSCLFLYKSNNVFNVVQFSFCFRQKPPVIPPPHIVRGSQPPYNLVDFAQDERL